MIGLSTHFNEPYLQATTRRQLHSDILHHILAAHSVRVHALHYNIARVIHQHIGRKAFISLQL